nr:hypothetical protein [Tanacetum cinerariifolium]
MVTNARNESCLSMSRNRATIKTLVIMLIHMTCQVLSESEDLFDSECDVPACDEFTTFSNLLFDADDDFSSSDNESFCDEDSLKEIYSNLLFDEEIISIKIDPHHFNAESDLIESLLNHNSSIISSSSKIDCLLDEFAGELILLKLIPPGNRYQRKGQNRGQNQTKSEQTEERGKVNQVKEKVKVKPVKTGHGFGKSTKNQSLRLQTLGSGISILLAVGTPFTSNGNLYCQWELSPGSGNALCILFPTMYCFLLPLVILDNGSSICFTVPFMFSTPSGLGIIGLIEDMLYQMITMQTWIILEIQSCNREVNEQ